MSDGVSRTRFQQGFYEDRRENLVSSYKEKNITCTFYMKAKRNVWLMITKKERILQKSVNKKNRYMVHKK